MLAMTEPTLRDKFCMITGATNGIGKAAALALARLGGALVIVGRDQQRGEQTRAEIVERTGNRNVELLLADFSSQ
jgi:short-subunit dehydrogenase